DNVPRGAWRLGRVTKQLQHSDGYIRSVELKCRNRLIERALDQVFPLELCSPDKEEVEPIVPLEQIPDEVTPNEDHVDLTEENDNSNNEVINPNFDYEIEALPIKVMEPHITKEAEEEASLRVQIERDTINQSTLIIKPNSCKENTRIYTVVKKKQKEKLTTTPVDRLKELKAKKASEDKLESGYRQ
ncbi:unnamed protein product, partial [Auanema sp. JU1783]